MEAPAPKRSERLPRRRVGVRDVAKFAGVSTATVSLSLHGDPRIRRQTRELVMRTAKQLNYYPMASARALSRGRTHTIGVVFSEVARPDASPADQIVTFRAYSQMLIAVKNRLMERDSLCSLAGWAEPHSGAKMSDQQMPRLFREVGVEGLIIIQTPTGPQLEQKVRSQRMPYVAIDATPALGRVTVIPDDCRAMELAVEHLVELGHRRIAYVEAFPCRERAEFYRCHRFTEFPRGYSRAMARAGLPLIPGSDGLHKPQETLDMLWQRAQPPTALICYDDHLAQMMMCLLVKRGISVPGDVSVVALRDIGFVTETAIVSCGLVPALTCKANMQTQMAEVGVQLLLDHIDSGGESPMESVVLEPRLVVRESTGPCPG